MPTFIESLKIFKNWFQTAPWPDKVVFTAILQLVWHCIGIALACPVKSSSNSGRGRHGPSIWTLMDEMGRREEERLIAQNHTKEEAHTIAEVFVHNLYTYTIIHFCVHGLGIFMSVFLMVATNKLLSSSLIKLWMLYDVFHLAGFVGLSIKAYLDSFYDVKILAVSLAATVVNAYFFTLVWTLHKKLPEIREQRQNQTQTQAESQNQSQFFSSPGLQTGAVGNNNNPLAVPTFPSPYGGTQFQGQPNATNYGQSIPPAFPYTTSNFPQSNGSVFSFQPQFSK